MASVFISHTHSDQPIADALAELMQKLFGSKVTVNYSSRKELEGGIPPGDDWFRWIVEQVRNANAALILLTPASIQKPWVIWESGAVAGAAFANSGDEVRVFPLTFGIKASDVPTPFARTQLVTGTDESEIGKLVDDLFNRFGKEFTQKEVKSFGAAQGHAVQDYLERVRGILLKLPLIVTEAGIQEWLTRLEDFERDKRFSEAPVIENWLDVAFGRDAEDRQRPLDVRVHRRLGEMYASCGQASDAARQLDLARQLAPRDIFLLRRLGKAYLDMSDTAKVKTILDTIEELDKTAFERNAENAALKARWCEQKGDLIGASKVLKDAYENIPDSYYLGDRLGQVLIALGKTDEAADVYRQVARSVNELREQNVWTLATALSAAIVNNDDKATSKTLEQIRELRPTRGELDSVERGVSKLVQALKHDGDIVSKLHAMEERT
jgi:tetratricopeptide (TPR) repeat protein